MLGQLTEHLQRPKGLAAIACAAALFFSALSLAGPVGKAEAIWYENDYVTVDGDAPGVLFTVKSNWTNYVLVAWAGPVCDQDITGDGTSGSRMDRAYCVLDLARGIVCPHWPDGYGYDACSDVFSRDEWDDADGALNDVAGGNECVAIHAGSTESGPYNYTSRDISEDECA